VSPTNLTPAALLDALVILFEHLIPATAAADLLVNIGVVLVL
jgi:hypothetical protein